MMKIEPRGKVLIDGEGNVSVCEGGYEVEMILDSKVYLGQTYYLVKWAGYGMEEATWEKRKYLRHLPDMIEEFEKAKEATTLKSKYRAVKGLSQRTKFWGDVPSDGGRAVRKRKRKQITEKNNMKHLPLLRQQSLFQREEKQEDSQQRPFIKKTEEGKTLRSQKGNKIEKEEEAKEVVLQIRRAELEDFLYNKEIYKVIIGKKESGEYSLVARGRYQEYEIEGEIVYRENAEAALKVWEAVDRCLGNLED